MRMLRPIRILWTLGLAAVGLLPLVGVASASVDDVSIERSGSIIVFPKVIWDGTRDTIIRITNTSNSMLHAHCFYVNAAPLNPLFPPGPTNPPQWNETDFDVWLTRQQPTHWVASLGRFPNAISEMTAGDNAGFSPGLIPPVQEGFIGELKCIQVDASDMPLRGNALKGEATLRSLSGDVSEYNAVAFQGNTDMTASDPRSSGPTDLVLDLTPSTDSISGDDTGQYSACPDTLLFDHLTQDASDPVIGQLGADCSSICIAGTREGPCESDSDCGPGGVCGGCPISTELTLVPCSENFENQLPGSVTIQFVVRNEFEQKLSTSTTVSCFLNLPLDAIGAPGNNPFTFAVQGTLSAYTRITPAPDNGGVIGVAEEFRSATFEGTRGPSAAAAYALHTEGNRFDAATTVLNGNNVPAAGVTDHIIVPQP